MLEINVKDTRDVSFEMEISGIGPNDLEGRLRMVIDNIEYGIPAKITETEIKVEIPPLKRLVQRELSEGETFSARLDVFGDGHYLMPWSGEFQVRNPVVVEATIVDGGGTSGKIKKPAVKVSVSENKTTRPPKNTGKVKTRKVKLQEGIKKGVIKKKTHLFESKEHFKKSLTKEHVFKWLNSKGTKNPQIQEILYEQAETEAGSDKPYKILVALKTVIKK